MVGEAFFKCLEFGPSLCDVDYLRERNNRIFEDSMLSGDKLLKFFVTTLFDWSRAWVFTSSKSIPLFLDSLFSCT